MLDRYDGSNVARTELLFFLAGITVGVIAALLIAPYTGEETRELIRRRVDEGRDRATDMIERGRDFVERGRGSIGETIGYGKRTVQEKI